MFRKLLRLLIGGPEPSSDDDGSTSGGIEPSVDSEPNVVHASCQSDAPVELPVKHIALRGLDADWLQPGSSPGKSEPSKVGKSKTSGAKRKRRSREDIQAAAVARRKSRQQAAAELHVSDITFLGRGVSRGLGDHRSDTDRLSQNALPVLSTPADVAQALQMKIPRLRWLAFHSDAITRSHYYTFQIPRKNGRLRTLQAPHRTMAYVQGWILDEILYRIPVHDAAHGFVPERSVMTNAKPHLGARVVINTDLKDFFPAITFARVSGLFRSLGYSPAVATILALLCTEAPRQELVYEGVNYLAATGPRALPQGACTSPAISNLITRTLDRRLQGMADKLNWTYTRYADDITWSTPESPQPSVGYVLARVRHIAEDEGFEINEEKTRVLRPNQRQSVTGVAVNDRLSVPRTTIRRVRAILHNAQLTGLEAQNRDNHPYFEHWLLGMIGWIGMVQPETGDKLRANLDQLRGG
jgi:RNA-directed DNA polymerase